MHTVFSFLFLCCFHKHAWSVGYIYLKKIILTWFSIQMLVALYFTVLFPMNSPMNSQERPCIIIHWMHCGNSPVPDTVRCTLQ